MNNLAIIEPTNYKLKIWEQEEFLTGVQEVFSKDLSKIEFKLFVEIGKALNLNPFLREIWAVKYGTTSAQIFIGRDGYRKVAQRHPDYDYHYCEAVYSNDIFEAKEGIFDHQFNLKDRGILRGAFCKVKKKSSERAFCVYVPFEEYNKNQSNWKTMPSTMIKKVAEAQCLRMAFQDTFSGTYSEEEDWIETTTVKEEKKHTHENADNRKIKEEPIFKPVVVRKQNIESQNVFNAVNEFNSKVDLFMKNIDKLCEENLGKVPIDSHFESSFRHEFLQYFREEFIKNNGSGVSFPELFFKKLTAKRLNVLALHNDSVRDTPLSEDQLKDLKRIVYEEFMKDQSQDLTNLFAKVAKDFIPF